VQVDEAGRTILGENGLPAPACSANGLPLYQYCVEGAVNEATVEVIGRERAIACGAVWERPDGTLEYNDWDDRDPPVTPAGLLGLDALAFEIHGEECGWSEGQEEDRLALEFNDEYADHASIMELLTTRLDQVRSKLSKLAGVGS
jgi:hypothetical protein